jgi:hypothetical protein
VRPPIAPGGRLALLPGQLPTLVPGHHYRPRRRVRELLPACCCGWAAEEWVKDEPQARRLREAYLSLPPGLPEWLGHLAHVALLVQLADDRLLDLVMGPAS